MTEAYEWRGRVGDAWAQEWRRTDRTLAPVNDALVAAAAAEAERFDRPRILDVGCGAGATSLALAAALADAEIIGIDLSDALIAAARERAGEGAENPCFEIADAACWAPARAGFDLIVSRHGVMFFADPVAAFAHLRALAGAEARLVFSCFRDRADNQWITALRPIFERFAPEALAAPDPPAGPFALGDPVRIAAILTAAGFAPPDIRALDFDFVAGAGEDAVGDAVAYFRRIGPFATLLRALDDRAGGEAIEALTELAALHRAGSRILFRAAAWIVCAKAESS